MFNVTLFFVFSNENFVCYGEMLKYGRLIQITLITDITSFSKSIMSEVQILLPHFYFLIYFFFLYAFHIYKKIFLQLIPTCGNRLSSALHQKSKDKVGLKVLAK